MAKKTNPYLYEHEAKGKSRYGYRREYKGKQLRARGFATRVEAENHLNQAIFDLDAALRGEVRCKPTTAQEALDIYRRKLEVRARDKARQYHHNVKSNCKVLQEFVDEFGPTRLIRECTETDLREFYQRLRFKPTISQNSAAVFVGRVQGMLKAAQEAKPDLVNWLRPKLRVTRKTEFERRVVEDWEYKALVEILLNPPAGHKFNSRKEQRAALWRDAADAVVLLRLTGGRLNEVLRMKLDQFNWKKGSVRLYASKTENERDVPLSKGIERVVRARVRHGLTKSESLSTDATISGSAFVFDRATTATFDNTIARACLRAARLAKLNYGQANGWTCHSLRHTFITHLMKVTGNDVGTVMTITDGARPTLWSKCFFHRSPSRKLMASTQQNSFEFERPLTGVLSIKPLRPSPDLAKTLDELAATLIGDSVIMQKLRRTIRTLATSAEPVLITGESGTGKELIARAIHDLSPRRKKAFLAVNCGALTESLQESELFGHMKGAFTGATTNKKGFFEAASGGTLFLDEFAEMSLAMQQRLLRVLQEGTVRPVGSTDAKEIEIDTRIVVATNHDLKRDISEGKFRHDLFYRVNVLQINSPALRERREDIPALTEHFIRQYNDKNTAKVSERISSEVLAVLEDYSWPGNVRELENIIKRLALTASHLGVITAADLHTVPELEQVRLARLPVFGLSQVSRKLNCISRIRKDSEPCRHNEQLNKYRQLLDETGGNLTEAARRLNIPRTTLRKRIISLQKKCVAG